MSEWQSTCVLCAARNRSTRLPEGHCCPACAQRIRDDLERILRLCQQAWRMLDPTSSRGGTRSVPGSRPPLNVEALDPECTLVELCPGDPTSAVTVLQCLEDWERLIREERALTPYGPASLARGGQPISGVLSFLHENVDYATTQPDFSLEAFATEIRACATVLRRYDPASRTPGMSLPCPTIHDDGTECGARLRFGDGTDEITCRRCKATRDVWQLVAVAGTDDAWADATAIASLYGIDESTIRRWSRSGRVRRQGQRFCISDVRTVLHERSSTHATNGS